MRIFNSDGTEAEMCGNGLRCFVKYLINHDFKQSSDAIEVNNRILTVSETPAGICIDMGAPSNVKWNIPFEYNNQSLIVHHLDTGVPHTVVFVEGIDSVNVQAMGSYIRHSWKPNGTNVTFAQQIGPQRIKIRTYERGVEKETPACGTGATAAAIAAAHLLQLVNPVTIETQSNEELIIDFAHQHDHFSQVSLIGPARYLFSGLITLDYNTDNSVKSC